MATGRTAPLKSFLLTQTGVAGIGNIYADEALHRAELHPLARGLDEAEHCEALVEESWMRSRPAWRRRRQHRRLPRRPRRARSMQDEFLVHTREGQPCPRGDGTIERIVVGGRLTYFARDAR